MNFEKLEEEIQDILYSISTEKGQRLLNTDLCSDVAEEIIKVVKEKNISCPLYVDYKKSCKALKERDEELKLGKQKDKKETYRHIPFSNKLLYGVGIPENLY